MNKLYVKGFDKDLRCRGYQFEVGKEYDTGYTENLYLCSHTVFHFCETIQQVHEFYDCNDETNRYCYVECLGELLESDDKCGSNKIKIVREIVGDELSKLLGKVNGNTGIFNSGNRNSGYYNSGNRNSGNRNSGYYNSGNRNSGNYNSGDYNSGNYNSGDYNSGDYNSGDYNSGNRNSGDRNSGYYNSGYYNSGDYNSGNYNSGDYNSGNYNSGDYNSGNRNSGDRNSGYYNSGYYNSGNYNSGDYNSGNYNSGFFNTSSENKIYLFDEISNFTYKEFVESEYYEALTSEPLNLTEWHEFTEEEKKDSIIRQCIGGKLITHTYKEACATWWDKLTDENKEIIKSIPNFNSDKFYEITGIDVKKEEEE